MVVSLMQQFKSLRCIVVYGVAHCAKGSKFLLYVVFPIRLLVVVVFVGFFWGGGFRVQHLIV